MRSVMKPQPATAAGALLSSTHRMAPRKSIDLAAHLMDLCRTAGLSGHEAPVRNVLRRAWRPLVDELSGDRIGSLWGIRRAARRPAGRILLAAHMDSIGLLVTRIQDGFLFFAAIGGIDARVLPGALVQVHATRAGGSTALPGVITSRPPHVQSADEKRKVTPVHQLMVDLGLSAAQTARSVEIGDLIVFAQPPLRLGGDLLLAPALDNRASVAALTGCLAHLCGQALQWDVVAAATVQEEEGFAGAYSSAFAAQPDATIAIDVTFGRQPGLPEWKTFKLGEGPTVSFGPNLHPQMGAALMEVAADNAISCARDVMPLHSGTDAYAMQVSRAGIPCGLVSIPLRNMHTPVEVVAMADVEQAARLLAKFVLALDGKFRKRLKVHP